MRPIVDDVGNKYFTAQGVAGNAGGVVDSGAEEVLRFFDCVACVNANPDSDWWGGVGEGSLDSGLDCLSAGDRAACTGERQHRPVALSLDNFSAIRPSRVPDHAVVLADDVDPRGVAEPGEHQRRVDDVSEDDRNGASSANDAERSGCSR